jgi:hypothetical protein
MTIRAFLGVALRTVNCVTCHRDGSVTFYDPLRQQWIENARTIPIHALTALPRDEEDRVRRHLERHA